MERHCHGLVLGKDFLFFFGGTAVPDSKQVEEGKRLDDKYKRMAEEVVVLLSLSEHY